MHSSINVVQDSTSISSLSATITKVVVAPSSIRIYRFSRSKNLIASYNVAQRGLFVDSSSLGRQGAGTDFFLTKYGRAPVSMIHVTSV